MDLILCQSVGQWDTEELARAVSVRSSLASSEVNVTVHTGDVCHLLEMQSGDCLIPEMHTTYISFSRNFMFQTSLEGISPEDRERIHFPAGRLVPYLTHTLAFA